MVSAETETCQRGGGVVTQPNAAVKAAQQAGWFYWAAGYWFSSDVFGVMSGEVPPYWSGTARDLCLARGIEMGESPNVA